MSTLAIPFIDQNVEHVGTTKLRELSSAKLRSNRKTLVIQENDTPLAVLLNYEQYLIMQNQLFSLLETIDVLTNQAEVEALKSGLADFEEGRTTSIAEIRAALNKRKNKGSVMAARYVVDLTKTARVTYERIFEDAQNCLERGDHTNSKVTLLNMVDEAIDKIIPHDPFNPERALQGPLSNVFRVTKARLRICYVGSSKLGKIVVLYISETLRKAGDAHDPYSIFTRLVLSGKFDEVFAELGIKQPPRQGAQLLSPPTIQ